MGSVCCVARKDRTLTNGTSGEILHRNAIYSPSWSFRWDNRRRVAGEIENISYAPSHGISTNSSMEIKGELIFDRGNLSGRGSPLGNFGTPTSQKSPVHEGLVATTITSSGFSLFEAKDTFFFTTIAPTAPHPLLSQYPTAEMPEITQEATLSIIKAYKAFFCTMAVDSLLAITLNGFQVPLLGLYRAEFLNGKRNVGWSNQEITLAGNDNTKVQSSTESPEIIDSSAPKISLSVPSSSSLSTSAANHLSSQAHSLPSNSTQSRRAHQSPGHQLLRQVSDSRIVGLKSPNSNLVSEGGPSFVPSNCSNDLMLGSQGASSDGWSMRTFSELVASSQRERWSFDSEFLGSGRGKLSESSGALSYSPSIDLQTCGVCSKLLTERCSWSSQKIIATNELSVVAVLVCGHAYHAECLEAMTQEADRYDPSCPFCTVGEKKLSKMARKVMRAEAELKSRSGKISRNRVLDNYHDDAEFDVLDRRKTSEGDENFHKMEPSSSARRSFAKPFLRRHFSLGSKWSRSMSENNSARKGFWARYRKD
ncbi:hypothetical protein TEA_028766 [Camellia sinensis var. sinensis]|uniref:RING-type domain-containing protein n=1 Tax=Camellia sinensis var. sinensis TaxID=542762 RepID=A0A4S4ETJ3_CAMSN|nr:hypothetical protein TEA_028766 [Camellia sinensis var. sinensis]